MNVNNYSIYVEQIREIVANTEKKMKEGKAKELAKDTNGATAEQLNQAVQMLKLSVNEISKYVQKEAAANKSFEAALGYPWKNAERMLKHVFGEAKKIAVTTLGTAFCYVPDNKVFDWVNEYYMLDDREEIERKEREAKEKAEKAAAAAKKKKEEEEKKKRNKELSEKAKAMAEEQIKSEIGYDQLTDEEKDKKIKSLTRKIKNQLAKEDELNKLNNASEKATMEVANAKNNKKDSVQVADDTNASVETKTDEAAVQNKSAAVQETDTCNAVSDAEIKPNKALNDVEVTNNANSVEKCENEANKNDNANSTDEANTVSVDEAAEQKKVISPSGKNGQFSLFDLLAL